MSDDHIDIVAVGDVSHDLQPSLISGAALLLSRTWPKIGYATRIHMLTSTNQSRAGFILIANCNGAVIAVAKVQPLHSSFRDSVAHLTCFLVHEDYRGRGLARRLYWALERRALDLNYVRIYLETDLTTFWSKFGYSESPRPAQLSLSSRLDRTRQRALESILLQRRAPNSPNEDNAGTWMTKAIVEDGGFVSQDEDWWMNEVQLWTRTSAGILALIFPAPFYQQIGPSCGLAALKTAAIRPAAPQPLSFRIEGEHRLPIPLSDALLTVRRYCSGDEDTRFDLPLPDPEIAIKDESLLRTAIAMGFTYRGEMFSAIQLAMLAHLHYPSCLVRIIHKQPLAASDVVGCIARGQRVLIAYDRSAATHNPVLNGGRSAHWLAVTGVIIVGSGRDDVRLVGQHGLSRRPLIAPIVDVLRSNAQLSGPLPNESQYKIGAGGLQLQHYMVVIGDRDK